MREYTETDIEKEVWLESKIHGNCPAYPGCDGSIYCDVDPDLEEELWQYYSEEYDKQ